MIFKSLFSIATITLLSTTAQAQNATGASSDPMKGIMLQLPVILAMLGILYMGVIRPQKQQQKRQNDFLGSLKKGEEVVTSGGILGTIVGMNERVVTLEIAQGTEIKILKAQVQGYVTEAIPTSK